MVVAERYVRSLRYRHPQSAGLHLHPYPEIPGQQDLQKAPGDRSGVLGGVKNAGLHYQNTVFVMDFPVLTF